MTIQDKLILYSINFIHCISSPVSSSDSFIATLCTLKGKAKIG